MQVLVHLRSLRFVLVFMLLGYCYSESVFSCWTYAPIINVAGNCPPCDNFPSCPPPSPSATYTQLICADSGSNPGFQCCQDGVVLRTATYYYCDADYDLTAISICAAAAGLSCAAACTAGPLACVTCLAGVGISCANCNLIDSCTKTVGGTMNYGDALQTGSLCNT